MADLSQLISSYYDRETHNEWQRLERHRTEYAVTLRAMEAQLPPPPARILDIGGGPGRYAIALAQRGYQVTLFDLSAENLKLARQKAQEAGIHLQDFLQGTATHLAGLEDGAFDAVLLMGPLYHLLEESDRRAAIYEAVRVLKPGGCLLASFITRFAAHRDMAHKNPEAIATDVETSDTLLMTGKLLPPKDGSIGFFGYFTHPTEAAPLLQAAGLEVRTVMGVEGLAAHNEEKLNQLQGETWERWVDVNYQVAFDPAMHGAADHLLVAAVKPLWRAVLYRIAARLNEAGLDYQLVGGASTGLHGVPVPVYDLDIEMDEASVYQFQEMFAELAVLPVDFRESEIYRSHFGRFDFDGVMVEVMGDLERREGERWVPTTAATRTQVDLDGVPVNVSTLEEETLAYLRRGRFDRVCECLPYCDHARLMPLIRREKGTPVL